MIVYITIGNSDDRLTQAEWSEYIGKVYAVIANAVSAFDGQLHGEWFSATQSPWQNACWCVALPELDHPRYVKRIKDALRQVAETYRQDSIAWSEATTEFLKTDVKAPDATSDDVNIGRRVHTLACGCPKRSNLHRVDCPTKPNGLISHEERS